MSDPNQKPELKYFVVARQQTGKIIYTIGDESSQEKQYKAEGEKLLSKLLNSKFQALERQKINSSSGNWFATLDSKEIFYLVLTSQSYAERHAYGLITELIADLGKSGDYQVEDDASLKFLVKNSLKSLFPKYQDTKQFDKIQQAQENVDQVRVTMSKNINQTLQNQQNLRKVEEGSINLNKQANVFAKQAKDLERMMYWRKVKLNIILALVVIAILCFIILPIVLETTAVGAFTGGGDSEPPKPVEPAPADPNANPNTDPNAKPDPQPQPQPQEQPSQLQQLKNNLEYELLNNNKEQQIRRQLIQEEAYVNPTFLRKQQ